MGILNAVKNLFKGVGRKRLVSGARVIVHMDGKDVLGRVLQDKDGSRRKRVRVQLFGGGTVVVKKRDVTVA